MPDRLNPFSALPVAAPERRRPVLPAPPMVFRAAPHLASDMALGVGHEIPDPAPAGTED